MNRVLTDLKNIITNSISARAKIKRIEIGLMEEMYELMKHKDTPFILISPNGVPQKNSSFWANHCTETYYITIYIVFSNKRPNDSRIETDSYNQGWTITQVSDELKKILGANKNLGGIVRGWSGNWEAIDLVDNLDGVSNQILEIKTDWFDDLIPFSGHINNQFDLIHQT